MRVPAYVPVWLFLILALCSVTAASVLTQNFVVEHQPLICHQHRSVWICERKQ